MKEQTFMGGHGRSWEGVGVGMGMGVEVGVVPHPEGQSRFLV